MKNKLLSLAGLLAVFNLNAIEIGPTGSGAELSGFVVMDYVNENTAGDNEFTLTEVELNFDWSTGPVAFSLDYNVFGDGRESGLPGSGEVELEEAVLTYSLNDNLSVSAGRMLTYLGFEAYDAPNMYQISYAYNTNYTYLYDKYADGVSVDYATDVFSVGIWADLAESMSFEYAFAYTGIENLTAKYIYGDYAGSSESKQTIWASYTMGSLLVAAEVAKHEANAGIAGDDTKAYLLMGNYGFTDELSLTLRFSNTKDEGSSTLETEKFTVSPSYMITDDLCFLGEYSDIEGEDEFVGLELIYTF